MTEQMLMSVLLCICGKLPNMEDRISCVEKYTNCAVIENGKILTKQEFDKKCYLTDGQGKCY